MQLEYDEKIRLISYIGSLDDNNDRIKYFCANMDMLLDYNMIFVDLECGHDKTEFAKGIAEMDFDVNSLYCSSNLLCFNEKVVENQIFGRATALKNQIYFSLDINIVSRLKNYINGINDDADISNVIKFCSSGKCSFDIMSFIIENLFKNKYKHKFTSEDIADIRAFETLFQYNDYLHDDVEVSIDRRVSDIVTYYEE